MKPTFAPMFRILFFTSIVALAVACNRKADGGGIAGVWQIERITDSLRRTIVDRSKYDSMFLQTMVEMRFSYQAQELEFTKEDSLKLVADIENMWNSVFGKTYNFTSDGTYIIGNMAAETNEMTYDTMTYEVSGENLTMNNKGDKMVWKFYLLEDGTLHLSDEKTNLNTFLSKVSK